MTLTNINFKKSPIKELFINGIGAQNLDTSNLTNLNFIEVDLDKVNEIDLRQNRNLTTINIDAPDSEKLLLPLSVEELKIWNIKNDTLDLRYYENINKLYLANNSIKNLKLNTDKSIEFMMSNNPTVSDSSILQLQGANIKTIKEGQTSLEFSNMQLRVIVDKVNYRDAEKVIYGIIDQLINPKTFNNSIITSIVILMLLILGTLGIVKVKNH